MAKISISLPDELRSLHRRTKIENRSALIESNSAAMAAATRR